MRFSASTRRTLATVAAFLMLLAGLLLAASKLGDDSSGAPDPTPSSSPTAPATTAPPSPSTPPASEPPRPAPSPTAPMPSDPTNGSCNVFDPECPGTSGGIEA
ncbi:hypothetical protein [Streptomyces sp. NPDC005799]|uniref:hypothetical protein n=1 Tax=Streptomyces sp. NPDC005799 TaxID=3154678 RepID=UPI003408296A